MSTTPDQQRGLDYAWQWFSLHASQRTQAFYFFLTSLAITMSAYVLLVGNHHYGSAAAVALFALIMIEGFRRIERRTRQLVKLGKAALNEYQARLALDTGVLHIDIVRKDEECEPKVSSYGFIFQALHKAAQILCLLDFSERWQVSYEIFGLYTG